MVPTATTPLSRYTLRSRLRHIGQPLGKREQRARDENWS
jgi:hypothetical protein